ncbi:MAG TPA: M48 family metallopeptidase [Leptospiraceae bacterium]|nr:M48 family metallopeptidase [Leptospiraceae bacterium]HMY66656.1 M48 family metallopeptidase [Leptospiraceae bacterium]HNF13609.1 M48 family metallopeptidase [Leptospiraceae bacterium]HNI98075.1 M48 family metallopeptidase [Leptospiraceae bacterium]HNN04504.1 M48 family metallopeptidase [Leptospiraceae bacterium]
MKYIIMILCFGISSVSAIEPVKFKDALWNQVESVSKTDYKSYVEKAGGNAGDHKGWKKTVDEVFRKLSENSGNPAFHLEYAILKEKTFNAAAFPGGQFVIHSGLLDALDRMVQERKGLSESSPDFAKYRAHYLAPVIAHELGHFYNKHTYKSYLAKIEKTAPQKTDEEESRELELDADLSGILLLEKSGYGTDSMEAVLEKLNEIRQKSLNAGEKINIYFETHPSPHERLAQLKKDTGGIHAWASRMEYIFSDIQSGKNLEKAVKELDKVLIDYPRNLDFQKAKAVALHKIWLESDILENLKMKGIIDLPSFRDSMIFDQKAKKSAKKAIPGDRQKYTKALTAYRNIIKENEDPWLVSNFAVLLVYSPAEEDEANAIQLAEKAFHSLKNVQTLNNLAMCHYLAELKGNSELALHILRGGAKLLNPRLDSVITDPHSRADSLLSEFRKGMKKGEEDDGTLLLNLAMADQKKKKEYAQYYLELYDSSSKWAEYLAKTHSLKTVSGSSQAWFSVDGIHLKSSIRDVLEKWNEPDRKPEMEDGLQVWYYDSREVKLSMRNGFVEQIMLYGDKSPSVEGLKVGSDRTAVEKFLGKNPKTQNRYLIYENKDKVGLTFEENKVERLILFE